MREAVLLDDEWLFYCGDVDYSAAAQYLSSPDIKFEIFSAPHIFILKIPQFNDT